MATIDGDVEAIATPQRAVEVVGALLGPTVSFGPTPAGPHGMATARADRRGRRLTARRVAARAVQVSVPVRLEVSVQVGTRTIPADADLVVRVLLTARVTPDTVEVDVAPVGPDDVDADIRTYGVGGVFLRRLGDIEAEVRHHVRIYVDTLLATPEAIEACRLPRA